MSATLDFALRRHDIGGMPIAEIARTYGTPTYVYDMEQIGRRIDDLRSFDVIRYAQKANSNLAVLDYMRRRGVWVDAVSAGEVHRALRAGYRGGHDPREIVYTADIFDRDALDCVREHDIHCNLGSPDMIDQYGRMMPGRPVTLRINPGFGHGHSQTTNTGGPQSKHGIWFDQLGECLDRARHYDLQVDCLHMHIGSGTDLEHLSQVCGAMERMVLESGAPVTSISAGGGLPIAYRADEPPFDPETYFHLWDQTRQRLQSALGRELRLEIEPGRYLVAEAGHLITEIRAVKRMGENLFYLVDAGFNNLARPILYGAYHPISIHHVDGRDEDGTCRAVVGGPLCESGDIFTQEAGGYVAPRELPVAEVGDILILERAGAYGFVMGSNYNSKPLAAEVAVLDGKCHLIRERQSLDDLIRGERVPWA